MASFNNRFQPPHALAHHLYREIDQQDGIFGDDAHQHQDADQNGHGDGIAGDDQRRRHAADGERQRKQDGEGLDDRFEQQDQHCQHKHQAHDHGVTKAGVKFGLNFGIARFGDTHRRGQLHGICDFLEPRSRGAKRYADRQVGANGGTAFAVQTVYHAWPFGDGDFGHRTKWHGGPCGRGHFQCGNSAQIGAGIVVQTHADGNLAAINGQFCQGHVVIADGSHTNHRSDLLGGYAKTRRFFLARFDLHFGAGKGTRCSHTRKQRITAKGGLQACYGGVQVSLVRRQDREGNIPFAPIVQLEGAHIGDVCQQGENIRLHLILRSLATFAGGLRHIGADQGDILAKFAELMDQRMIKFAKKHGHAGTANIAFSGRGRPAKHKHVFNTV